MHTKDQILELDRTDTFAHKRKEFLIPEDVIYLDGNSLGPSTKAARASVTKALNEEWQTDLIASWNKHHWIDLPKKTADKIAKLIGAKGTSVTCCDSISVNLFKLINAALSLSDNRKVVVSEENNFPTDLYITQGIQSLIGKHRCELKTVTKNRIMSSLNHEVAVLLLTHVDFRTGEMLDMQRITEQAHKNGTLVIWDLAHSAGAVPLQLDRWKVDFAVGCGYKYLNGGPGSPAFVYVNEQHLENVEQPLSGWMGHKSPFDFRAQYQPAESIDKFLCGTPPILSLAALNGALDVFQNVRMKNVREKSEALKQCFLTTLKNSADIPSDLKLVTPANPLQQGSQLSFTHEYAYELSQALIEQKVIVDFRAPNIVRFGFTPLYLSFDNVHQAATTLSDILVNKTFLAERFKTRSKVT